MIKLIERDIGRWVTYEGAAGERERGRIKAFNNERQVAFVVYKANNNWDGDHWKDYTAAATSYRDILEFKEEK
jgi:hypothetical protein